jgi:recombinational DNA repair ATPase RecF
MIDIGDFLTSRKGRNGMAEDFVALMQAIAPEMAETMARRAMVLTAIAESAPVGRRQLALRLNLAEREVRADVEKLRDAGLITLDKAGMNPTPNASRWLESARSEDIYHRATTVGPHRDDLDITLNGISARKYGSQGQQRSCVLSLKLAEAEILQQKSGLPDFSGSPLEAACK